MGYYTDYTLLVDDSEILREVVEQIFSESGYLMKVVEYNEAIIQDAKWYDHDADMKRISKKFEDVIFELTGEGEEQGDVWRTYYVNGHCKEIKRISIWDLAGVNDFIDNAKKGALK